MNEFLNEVARLWWVEVGTKLQNPLSEESLNGLRKILKEEYDFDSEVIEYIIESAVKTPTNFHLGGNRESGMQVGSNDTAVSAHLHHDGEDDEDGAIEYDEPIEEEENDEKDDKQSKERPDSGDDKEKSVKDISKGSLTAKEKEELKEIDDKLLKTKLTNPTTGNKNQVSTLLGKKKSDPAAYKVGRNFLGDKGVSDDEIETQSDSSSDDRPKIPNNAEELQQKDHQITDSQLYMTKTEAEKQANIKGAKDVGAGTAESRAGEAMVHKGLRLLQSGKSLDEINSEFNELVNSDDHILNSKSGKEWVTSAMASLKNIDETVGIKNIQNVSWDTPQGRESIGIDPKLETSSDMFVRTKDGKNIGLSLKKTGQVFLNNGGWAKQSEKLLGALKEGMPEDDHKRLSEAMSIGSYKKDLRQRFQKSVETVGVDEITSSLEKLKKENPLPSYFKNSKKYFPILENPAELVEKLKGGKLKGDEMKAYSKLLQYNHTEEYNMLRQADDALTQRTFGAINKSEAAKNGMKKHIVKSMHIAETLGLDETIKKGGVDGFQTTYGIKPDGAVLNEKTLKTLLGSKFTQKLDEVILEVRQGKSTTKDLNQVIQDSIEMDYESGQILFKHENNKKYPLFYMQGRTRGIGASPTMEMAQTPFMAHALKMGTFNTDEWDEKSLKRFKKDIEDAKEELK